MLGVVSILAGVGVLIWSALVHPVHPSGDIGYGDIAVGVGTLILAVVTLGSVLLGWQALRDTVRATDLSALEGAASGHGLFTITAERDGIVRRAPMVFAIGDRLVPMGALEETPRRPFSPPYRAIDRATRRETWRADLLCRMRSGRLEMNM